MWTLIHIQTHTLTLIYAYIHLCTYISKCTCIRFVISNAPSVLAPHVIAHLHTFSYTHTYTPTALVRILPLACTTLRLQSVSGGSKWKTPKALTATTLTLTLKLTVATCETFKCGIRGKIGFIDRGIMRLLAASRLMDGSELLCLAPFKWPWAALTHSYIHAYMYMYVGMCLSALQGMYVCLFFLLKL